jgi:hypothetical protein
MPSAVVYYPSQSYWQTAREILGSGSKRYPLPLEPTHYVTRRLYKQRPANFAAMTRDTADPADAAAYLIDEQDVGETAAFKAFFRDFAKIPATWTETGNFAFRYPAVPGSVTYGSLVTSSVSAALDGNGSLVVTKNSHGLSAPQVVFLYFTDSFGGRWSISGAITATTANTFTCGNLKFASGTTFSSVSYKTMNAPAGHGVIDDVPTCRIVHEYALPGVTTGIATKLDFKALPRLKILDADGTATDTLSATTSPTVTEWLAAVAAGQDFVVESDVKPAQGLGNIIERVTKNAPYL